MAAADTARLIASLELESRKFDAGVKQALKDVDKLDSRLSRIGANAKQGLNNLAKNVASIGVIAGVAAAGIITKSIAAASDLNETISKTGVVFGQASAEVLAWGKDSASALGLSQNAALGAAATYGNLFVSMGLATDKSAEMSTNLVDLAADLASFNNLDPTEVTEKLRAGLTGESEPLKSLGININEVILKQKAFDLGLTKTTKEVLPAAIKAQAAYALIFEQSATAQGDFARTSTGLANQQRILRANLDNTAATIGTALLPKVSELVQKINKLVVARQPEIERLAAKLPAVFDKVMNLVMALPWESIESAFKVMGMGAEAVLTAFTAMPPWVQTAVITGWGLNKLTGGALGSIVGELGKGLIKGVLGMNAGVVNLNAASVTGLPGVGGAAATGGLGLASKVFLVGEAIGLALLVNHVRNGIAEGNTEIAKGLTAQTKEWLAQNPSKEDLRNGLAAVEGGIKELNSSNLPLTLVQGESLNELQAIRGLINDQLVVDMSPEARQSRSDAAKALKFMASASKDDKVVLTGIGSTLTAMQSQMHADLIAATEAIETSNDPAAISAAVTAALTATKGGAGSAGTTKGLLGDLEAQLKAAEAANNKPLAALIRDAIKQIEPFAKGRQWQAEQIAAAQKVADSNRSTADKVAALKGIQQDLLSHQRTMAGGIVSGLIDIVTAVKNIKITMGAVSGGQGGGALPRNQRPGFTPPAPPVPRPRITPGGFDPGLVVNANVTVSTRDIKSAQIIRGRMGATPIEAGSA